jgi:hypothetical protein
MNALYSARCELVQLYYPSSLPPDLNSIVLDYCIGERDIKKEAEINWELYLAYNCGDIYQFYCDYYLFLQYLKSYPASCNLFEFLNL